MKPDQGMNEMNAQRICTHAYMAKGKEVTWSVEQNPLFSPAFDPRVRRASAHLPHTVTPVTPFAPKALGRSTPSDSALWCATGVLFAPPKPVCGSHER
jgi:hypothetical protein